MEYLALYRRYRPDTFDKLIGQDGVVKTLINQIEKERLGHAYLFTGSRGTGKTSAAKIFSKAINCLSPVNGSPCGKCAACIALSDPSNIDVLEIDAASNNGVNEIRDLREKVQFPPVSVKYKVYIIDEVHMLTGAAFNALLKTLEEPPKHAVFILATTEAHKIPATILSRCMRFDFKLIPTETIAELISKIYDEQGKKYQKEAVFAIAKAGDGSIRDALSVADMALSFGTGELTYDDVMEVLGATNEDVLYSFIDKIINSDVGGAVTVIDKLATLGKSMGVLTKDIINALRDIVVVKICENPNEILNLPKDKFEVLKSIADSTNTDRLLRLLEIFAEVESNLRYSISPRTVFETATIKASRPDSDYNVDALLSRIKTLEDKLEKGEFVVKKENTKVIDDSIENLDKKNDQKKNDVEISPKIQLKKINEHASTVVGELFANLRKNGHEMLWTVLQSVGVGVAGNVLVLEVENEGDIILLDREDNKGYIMESLSDYEPFAIQVKLSDKEREANKFDEETERIKKLFGDDIVIIKED